MRRFLFFSSSEPEDTSPYSGFVGLNTGVTGFADQVMSPDDIRALFAGGREFVTPFAYPQIVAQGFDEPVIFRAAATDEGIDLTASIVMNTEPTDCSGRMAQCILPASYSARDNLVFVDEPGYGPGSVRITSVGFTPASTIAEWMLSVTNRPGLFLKIINSTIGSAYTDMAIFFPDHVGGLTHWPVRHGEAFVLVEGDVDLTHQRVADINASFGLLVRKSYGDTNGLWQIQGNHSIEDMMAGATIQP